MPTRSLLLAHLQRLGICLPCPSRALAPAKWRQTCMSHHSWHCSDKIKCHHLRGQEACKTFSPHDCSLSECFEALQQVHPPQQQYLLQSESKDTPECEELCVINLQLLPIWLRVLLEKLTNSLVKSCQQVLNSTLVTHLYLLTHLYFVTISKLLCRAASRSQNPAVLSFL